MSCYILKNELIEELAESIRYALDNPNNATTMFLCVGDLADEFKDCFKKYNYNSKLIAEKLYRFNEKAFCGRYNEKPAEIVPEFHEGVIF